MNNNMTFEQVAARVGKRPQTAAQIAVKLGYPSGSGQAVSRSLGTALKAGLVARTDNGRWIKA